MWKPDLRGRSDNGTPNNNRSREACGSHREYFYIFDRIITELDAYMHATETMSYDAAGRTLSCLNHPSREAKWDMLEQVPSRS